MAFAKMAPIRLIINDPEKIYTYGSTVSGVVEVNKHTRTTHVSISIRVKTRVDMPLGRYDWATYKTYLVDNTITLYSGDDLSSLASADDRFVSLPFNIALPHETQLHSLVSDFVSLRGSSSFEHFPGHPLPPSLRAGGFTSPVYSVLYFIEARMANKSPRLHDEKRVQQTVTFSPPCANSSWASLPPLERESRKITCRSRWLLENPLNEHHGFDSHVRNFINRSSDPSASSTIITNVPTVARAGYPLPISIRLAHVTRTKGISNSPPVRLRGFCVTLKLRSTLRAPHARCMHDDQYIWHIYQKIKVMRPHWRKSMGICSNTSKPLLPADGQPLAIANFSHDGGVLSVELVAPTFKTYAIARRYELKVRLRV